MKQQKTYGLIFILMIALSSCQTGNQADKPTQVQKRAPNIIYIVADDLGYGDLGCYGQKQLKTPHIDQLAATGMRFVQHYAGATVCAPSRASLLTGKQPGNSSVRGNQPAGQLLKDEEITIPEALKAAGYTSACIGKWGVGHPPTPTDPLRNGFDEYYGYINMWHAHNFYPEFLYKNAEKVALAGNVTDRSLPYERQHPNGMPEGTGVAKEKGTYVLSEFEATAFNFIEKEKDNPFFLYLALNMPHANNEAGYYLKDGMEVPMKRVDGKQIPDYGQYDKEDWPNPEKGFARMIQLIDETVGKINAKVEELGIADNTIIIFTSDNGPHAEGYHKVDFFDSNGPLRGAKRDLYEGGIRVPLIIKWPNKVKAGSSSDLQCTFWDMLPTFCSIAEVPIPEGVDGISFLPTLLGNDQQQKIHEALYWEFYELGGRQAVRAEDWKYIKLNVRDPKRPIVAELYNLSTDLGEKENIIADHPEVVKRLEEAMKRAHIPHEKLSLFSLDINAETAF
ncbi:MAG: arylsulfatase [Bacteroidota bacterium]